MEHVEHTFEPIYDSRSRILILGTFPSVRSREAGFYYHHPRNRFWAVLADLTGEACPETIPEKKAMLLEHHIAIWDVVFSCDIQGSSDSSIKNVRPADIGGLLDKAPIQQIFGNGGKACQLYHKYAEEKTGRGIICLPSTSPANAAYSLARLTDIWRQAMEPFIK